MNSPTHTGLLTAKPVDVTRALLTEAAVAFATIANTTGEKFIRDFAVKYAEAIEAYLERTK